MCQRKIIGKGIFRIVPVMNGCDCPMVTQIRDVDHTHAKHYLRRCIDAKTGLFWQNGNPVEWRFCMCGKTPCAVLPTLGPLSDESWNMTPGGFIDLEESEEEGGSLGFV